MNDTREIESITFGVYSQEEILNMSVCNITSSKKTVSFGTVYDPRMGTTDSSINCETCKENAIKCPGHFGHIEFNEPIVHPLYYKKVLSYLNCFCFQCHRLLLTKEQLLLNTLNRYKGQTRFLHILEKLKKVDICCQPTEEEDEDGDKIICGREHPKIKFNTSDSSYYMVYTDRKQQKTNILITTEEINKIFNNIPNEDIEILGFDPLLCHPRNFIMSVLPVLPPADRPYVKADNKMCDDDITNQYCEIIKINNNLGELLNNSDKKNLNFEQREIMKQRCLASLRFRVFTTFNNSKGKAKHTTNGRPIKGIKERLTGKEGQIRNNLLGKRCDQTGRTVIGPDPTLRMGEIGLPEAMSNILTIPVKATVFNIDMLQDLIDNGCVKSIWKPDGETIIDIKRYRRGSRLISGDVIHRNNSRIDIVDGRELLLEGDKVERNGEIISKLKPSGRKYNLELGWIVDKPLTDGDFVLLNRQPTLHKASMLAVKVKIMKHKTIRMNLAITQSLNADEIGCFFKNN